MIFIQTEIPDVILVKPTLIEDDRGIFMESYQIEKFKLGGINCTFVQDNYVKSAGNILRGLHFQKTKPQGKLVRVIQGSVLDVAVDIRNDSPTYGKHISVLLSGDNKTMFWIPPGFAHGFSTLENDTIFAYKCSQ